MYADSGIIIKAIGGFYYVKTSNKVFECKLRGKFRKDKTSFLVGDNVKILIDDSQSKISASIEELYERKNYFVRPPIANIDKLFIVVSVCDPVPNTIIIDELIAIACSLDVEPILVISKTDLGNYEELLNIYEKAGITVILFSKFENEGVEKIKYHLKDSVSAFTGNSGVGKSTILNLVDKNFDLKTGITSKKLGRGKHTTRHVELLPLSFGGFVADTPGFSSIDILNCIEISPTTLITLFKDLLEFSDSCQFTSCSHTSEKNCSVKKARDTGKISPSRYESYLFIYQKLIKNRNKF